MVELIMGEGCFMKKKKMLKIKSKHHHHRHGHGFKHHGGNLVCGALAGHPGGIIGGVDIVVVLRGRHHHAGHLHGGEDHGHHHGKHHRKGHGHGPNEAGLKHRGGRHHHDHHHRFRGVGLIFQHLAGGEGSGAGGEQQSIEAAPTTPTVPQAEAMMNNLTLEADNEANQP